MKRNVYEKILEWKDSGRRKPLILKGARQVGKTWLMKAIGKNEYENYVLVDLYKEKEYHKIFQETKDPHKIIEKIELIKNVKIKPEKTLLILDEIQDSADALGSLKYFYEDANEYHIITAGSLIGTHLAKSGSYPVGKVNIIDVYPLTFDEFLFEMHEGMYSYYLSVKSEADYVDSFHNIMLDLYRTYLIVGGMPEAVVSWKNHKDPQELTEIHKEIVKQYEYDFTKHNDNIPSARILQVFRSIIPQLAKENNEKFMYSAITGSARARDFEESIEWLVTSGIAHRTLNISTPLYPINAYEILNYFKLFLLDVGMMKHMASVTNKSILLEEDFAFKGQINENFVLQQLLPQIGGSLHFYALRGTQEVDFILQVDENVIPVEVKSSKTKKATSFKAFIEKQNPMRAIRFNTNGYITNGKITNIPLYFASKSITLIKKDILI